MVINCVSDIEIILKNALYSTLSMYIFEIHNYSQTILKDNP